MLRHQHAARADLHRRKETPWTKNCSRQGVVVNIGESKPHPKPSHGRRAFVPKSSAYLRDQLSKLKIGAKVSVTFEEDTYTRSDAQLALFFVYATYAADASGFTKDEMYDILIKECFGVEKREWRGRTYEVRRLISNAAKMPTADMGLLIEHAKRACDFLGLNVPTAEELGYISNY